MNEQTLFSAGLLQVWKERAEAEHRKALAVNEIKRIENLYKEEQETLGVAEARRLYEERRIHVDKGGGGAGYEVPFWQQLSGLHPELEPGMNPNERAAKIAVLIEKTEILIRFELRSMEKRKSERKATEIPQTNELPDRDADGNPVTRWAGPSHLWDPVRAICFEFGMSPRKLSAFCKELTGMSVWQLVDVIRAETVRKKMKAALVEFVRAQKFERAQGPATPAPALKNGTEAEELYAALKASRRGPRFHRTTWATSLGFSSYPRMFQSCVLCYGKTPAQIEIELIEEIMSEMAATGEPPRPDTMCVLGQNDGARVDGTVKEGAERLAG